MVWVDALVQGVLLGGFYALLATGLSVMFGVMRLVNLAHGDLVVLFAFVAVGLAQAGLNPWLASGFALLLAPFLGYEAQRLILSRFMGQGTMALVVTFGLSVIIQNVLLEIFSADPRLLDLGSLVTASLNLGGVGVGVLPLLTFLVALGAILTLEAFFKRTLSGQYMRATADDPEAARLMGIPVLHVYGLAGGIAFLGAALSGLFLVARTTLGPLDGPSRLLFAFESVIIGGMGSLWGTLVGGVVLGVAQTLGNQVNPGLGALAGHLVFLAVLLLRPQGLLGSPRRLA